MFGIAVGVLGSRKQNGNQEVGMHLQRHSLLIPLMSHRKPEAVG